jgi:hypothetical protein
MFSSYLLEGVTKKKYKGRGGKRPGAGGKPTWKLGKTKSVRLPEAIAPQIIEFSRAIDAGALNEQDAIALIEKAMIFIQAETDF